MPRERELLTNELRQEVRAFVLRLWEVSDYDEWEDFIRAAGIKQTTAQGWRWNKTKPPIPAGEQLYRMIRVADVFKEEFWEERRVLDPVAQTEEGARRLREAARRQPPERKPATD